MPRHPSILKETVAQILIGGMLMGLCPPLATAQEAGPAPAAAPKQEPAPKPAAGVKANRVVPTVRPPSALPVFSGDPSDDEIFRARVFSEPLVPEHAPEPGENQALAAAILDYAAAPLREDTAALEAFLAAHPDSAWRTALLSNLGTVYRRTGYFQRALATWQTAWREGQGVTEPKARALVDVALAGLAGLYARLGRQDELKALLESIDDRSIAGSASEALNSSRQALAIMRSQPDLAFRCGPLAVSAILRALKGESDPRVEASPSTSRGTSLLAMKDLAATAGLDLVAVRRNGDAAVPVPALVHWKAGHFGALVKKERDSYLLQDPTFGDEMWVSASAVAAEASGAFLVRRTMVPKAWQPLPDNEASGIWGKGIGAGPEPSSPGPKTNCNCPPGMAGYALHKLQATISISDTPILYSVPYGPAINFTLTYDQGEQLQPQIFTYSNFGPKWKHSFMSFLEDDPNNPSQSVYYYIPGTGREAVVGFNPGTNEYAPHYESRAIVVRTATNPVRYERRTADGSVQVFSQTDGAISFPRRVFLTEIRDPQGNAAQLVYDGSMRLVAVVDAAGQVSTFAYDLLSDPLKITRITDPFGRSADFTYSSDGRLVSIRDVIGLTSSFTYQSGDFISELTTPYGTTRFRSDRVNFPVWAEATDPVGGTERVEYQQVGSVPGVVNHQVPASMLPAGMEGNNHHMDLGVGFYWDKLAYSPANDRTRAEITNWAVGPTHLAVGIPRAIKKPLENPVWYEYAGSNLNNFYLGATAQPSRIGRRLDATSSQIRQYEYNSVGRRTKEIDPLGRETISVYGNNNVPDAVPATGRGLDLLQVKVKSGTIYDLLGSYVYDSHHRQTSLTDAAGQVTAYTYNARGQIATVTTPPRAGISENRTTTYSYDTTSALLTSVAGPGSATTTYTYDAAARLASVTNVDNYTVAYEYDAFDRPVTTRYPDGSFEQVEYEKLDPVRQRDRLGRFTHVFYDPMRRVVGVRDSQGRTTLKQWCACGALDQVVDANGNRTKWERDIQGRVTKEVRANATFKTFVYEGGSSRLKEVVDAKGQHIQYSYALDDKRTGTVFLNAEHPTPGITLSYVDPSTGQADVHGWLRAMTDGTGTTVYNYRAIGSLGAGQVETMDGPLTNDTIGLAYDELGRIVSRTLDSVTTTWSYDELGRLATFSDRSDTFSYAYVGSTNRVQSVSYPNGQTANYSYMPASLNLRLQTIHNKRPDASTLSKFEYTYDPTGNIQTWNQQKDSSSPQEYVYEYDRANQLELATLRDVGGAIVKRYRYDYDLSGNRSTEQIDNLVTTTSFDAVNRMLTQVPGGLATFRGTTNEPAGVVVGPTAAVTTAGNQFTGVATVGTVPTNVTVMATDPSGNSRTNTYQTSVTGPTKLFAYDANGNLVSDGLKTYEWDAEGKLLATVQGVQRSEFAYDGQGRRVRITEKTSGSVASDKQYVWCQLSICQERDAISGVVTARFHMLGFNDANGNSFYYSYDHQVSVREVTNQAGALVTRYDYDPYGRSSRVLGTADSPFGYASQFRHSPSNLWLAPFRVYDPTLGRWLSEDPLGIQGGLNLYAYVRGNPVNGVDPLGLFGLSDWFHHYFFGNGAPIDLGSIGLLGDFQNAADVRNASRRFRERLSQRMGQEMLAACSTCPSGNKDFGFSERDGAPIDLTYTPNLYVLGNGSLKLFATCSGSGECASGQYCGDCKLQFGYYDRFIDVPDVADSISGDQELPYGVPFAITAGWTEGFHECGSM